MRAMTVASLPEQLAVSPTPRCVVAVAVIVAGLFAVLTGPLPPREQVETANWTVPEHRETDVLKWLGPLSDGAHLTSEWRIADVAIESTGLKLHLRDPSDAPGPWASLRLDGQPPKLLLDLPPQLPPDIRQRVQAATAKFVLPGPFVRTQPILRPPPLVSWSLLAAAYLTLRFFSALTLLLAGVWLARRLPRRLWLPYLALTALAAAARLWLSPATFLHEYYHVDESLGLLAGQPGFFNGYGGPALYSALVPWLPADPTWMFAVNGLAATLTVPVLGRLAASLWNDERAGLAAGLVLALLPLHLRWSAAEDQWILGTAWAVLALAAWLDAIDTNDRLAALVALLSAVLASQARLELIPFPAMLVVLAFLRQRGWLLTWLRVRINGLMLLIALLAAWPIALVLVNRPQPPQATLEHLQLWRDMQWRNSDWTPLPLQMLSVLSLVLALVRRNFVVLAIALAFLLWIGLPTVFYGATGPFLERTQLLSCALAVSVAVGALPLVLHALPTRIWLAGLLLMALVAVQDRRAAITALSGQQQEWTFLHAHLPLQNPPKRLLALAGQTLDRFPTMLFPDAIAPQILSQEEAVRTHNWPTPAPDLLYYQSMRCWFSQVDEPPVPLGHMHPLCAAVSAHYAMEPVAVADLPGPVGPMLTPLTPPPYKVGFFRLTGVQAGVQ